MSAYFTYEDSSCFTKKLSEDMTTKIVMQKPVVLGKNANVDYIVNVGDKVQVGDELMRFEMSFKEDEINKFLASIGDDLKEEIHSLHQTPIKSKYTGTIIDIKMYSTVELEELSPSLRKLMTKYYDRIKKKHKVIDKHDKSKSVYKMGVLLNESTGKIEAKYGKIKGNDVGEGVLIEFYIEYRDKLGVGDKITYFTALKSVLGNQIEEGFEPYSEFRPDEEVSSAIAPGAVLARMTPSILLTMFANKVLIELKRTLYKQYTGKEWECNQIQHGTTVKESSLPTPKKVQEHTNYYATSTQSSITQIDYLDEVIECTSFDDVAENSVETPSAVSESIFISEEKRDKKKKARDKFDQKYLSDFTQNAQNLQQEIKPILNEWFFNWNLPKVKPLVIHTKNISASQPILVSGIFNTAKIFNIGNIKRELREICKKYENEYTKVDLSSIGDNFAITMRIKIPEGLLLENSIIVSESIFKSNNRQNTLTEKQMEVLETKYLPEFNKVSQKVQNVVSSFKSKRVAMFLSKNTPEVTTLENEGISKRDVVLVEQTIATNINFELVSPFKRTEVHEELYREVLKCCTEEIHSTFKGNKRDTLVIYMTIPISKLK